jgi:ribonuclease HII
MIKKHRKSARKQHLPTGRFEANLRRKGYKYIAGCDEVGVGAWAGPLVVAAVILDPKNPIKGLNDSKKLSPKRRRELCQEIRNKAIDYWVHYCPAEGVDVLGTYGASRVGMEICASRLAPRVDYVLTDAIKLTNCSVPHRAIIHGDARSISVAAASILAKVYRDNYMEAWDDRFPEYGFTENKGYGTAYHKQALDTYGACYIHRKTFEPVRQCKKIREEGTEETHGDAIYS